MEGIQDAKTMMLPAHLSSSLIVFVCLLISLVVLLSHPDKR